MFKIFNLKTIDKTSGVTNAATIKQKLQWLFAGCPTRDRKVIDRFIQKKKKEMKTNFYGGDAPSSNTFSLPSS
jgi:hypothetical protein